MNNTVLTNHAAERGKERLRQCRKKALKGAEKAWINGKREADFNGKFEKTYMQNKTCESIPVVWNDMLYVFSDDEDTRRCITIHQLPRWFGKKKNFIGKEKIKNPKKYSAKYLCYD